MYNLKNRCWLTYDFFRTTFLVTSNFVRLSSTFGTNAIKYNNCIKKNHLPMVGTSWKVWNTMSQLWNFSVWSRDGNFFKHLRSLGQASQTVFENGHIRNLISSTFQAIWRWISLPCTLWWFRWRDICFFKVKRSAIQAFCKPLLNLILYKTNIIKNS